MLELQVAVRGATFEELRNAIQGVERNLKLSMRRGQESQGSTESIFQVTGTVEAPDANPGMFLSFTTTQG